MMIFDRRCADRSAEGRAEGRISTPAAQIMKNQKKTNQRCLSNTPHHLKLTCSAPTLPPAPSAPPLPPPAPRSPHHPGSFSVHRRFAGRGCRRGRARGARTPDALGAAGSAHPRPPARAPAARGFVGPRARAGNPRHPPTARRGREAEAAPFLGPGAGPAGRRAAAGGRRGVRQRTPRSGPGAAPPPRSGGGGRRAWRRSGTLEEQDRKAGGAHARASSAGCAITFTD